MDVACYQNCHLVVSFSCDNVTKNTLHHSFSMSFEYFTCDFPSNLRFIICVQIHQCALCSQWWHHSGINLIPEIWALMWRSFFFTGSLSHRHTHNSQISEHKPVSVWWFVEVWWSSAQETPRCVTVGERAARCCVSAHGDLIRLWIETPRQSVSGVLARTDRGGGLKH